MDSFSIVDFLYVIKCEESLVGAEIIPLILEFALHIFRW